MCRQAPSGDAAPEVAWCIPVRTPGLRAEPQVPAAAAPDMASRPAAGGHRWPAADLRDPGRAGPVRSCAAPDRVPQLTVPALPEHVRLAVIWQSAGRTGRFRNGLGRGRSPDRELTADRLLVQD